VLSSEGGRGQIAKRNDKYSNILFKLTIVRVTNRYELVKLTLIKPLKTVSFSEIIHGL